MCDRDDLWGHGQKPQCQKRRTQYRSGGAAEREAVRRVRVARRGWRCGGEGGTEGVAGAAEG
jgi:hypothetical protein